MAKSKRAGKSYQAYYSLYKGTNRWSINRKRKLERALKAQPTNTQVEAALKNIRYRRRTPASTSWSHQSVYYASLFKSFGCKAPLEMFSVNRNQKAPQGLGLPPATSKGSDRVSFSIANRMHDKYGNSISKLVWKQ